MDFWGTKDLDRDKEAEGLVLGAVLASTPRPGQTTHRSEESDLTYADCQRQST